MTSQIKDKVIPQIVGGDIGCGISCYNLQKVIKEKHYQIMENSLNNLDKTAITMVVKSLLLLYNLMIISFNRPFMHFNTSYLNFK